MGFLHWDPNRVIMTLPVVGQPIVWYGLFFASGFFIGIYLLLYLFRRYLLYFPKFVKSDVIDWNRLCFELKEKLTRCDPIAQAIMAKCENSHKQHIIHWRFEKKIDPSFKRDLLIALTNTLDDFKVYNQEELHLMSTKRTFKRLLVYAERKQTSDRFFRIRHRLFIEENFPNVLRSLNERAKLFGERLAMYVMIGTVVGARLGHVIFYEGWSEIASDPLMVVRVWEGGLASHGGVVGIFVALAIFFFRIKGTVPGLTMLRLVDLLVIPTAFAGGLIRVGNFFNQEVLGKASTLPWAVIFAHPADGSPAVPRHPAQIYEALFYLGVFFFLLRMWNRSRQLLPAGKLSGYFFLVVFSFRFLVEFLKEEQSALISGSHTLVMGQYLSLPLIALGIIFLLFSKRLFTKTLQKD